MKPGFLTELDVCLHDDCIWILEEPLIFRSAVLMRDGVVPVGFQTDLASVPRVPFVYESWGNRAHREAVLHDYLYRIGDMAVSFSDANRVFLEAMTSRGVRWWIKWPMYWAVCVAGWMSYHKLHVRDNL